MAFDSPEQALSMWEGVASQLAEKAAPSVVVVEIKVYGERFALLIDNATGYDPFERDKATYNFCIAEVGDRVRFPDTSVNPSVNYGGAFLKSPTIPFGQAPERLSAIGGAFKVQRLAFIDGVVLTGDQLKLFGKELIEALGSGEFDGPMFREALEKLADLLKDGVRSPIVQLRRVLQEVIR
jgi:hypothetical protein